MTTELIPHLQPVTWRRQTYVDLRTLSGPDASDAQKELWVTAVTMAQGLLNEIPPELLCDNPSAPAEAQDRRTAVPDLSFEAMMGDIDPIYMVAFEGGRCVDAWGMFAIVILKKPNPRFYRIRCRGVPGFPKLIDNTGLDESLHQPYAEAVADFYEFLSDSEFELEGTDEVLDIRETDTAVYYLTSGDITPADVRVRLLSEEITRRASSHPTHSIEKRPYRPGTPGINEWVHWETRANRKPSNMDSVEN